MTTLPFVIPTGAKRSGGISVWMLFHGNNAAEWKATLSGKDLKLQPLAFTQFNRFCQRNRRVVSTFLQTRADNIPVRLRCDTRASSGKRERPARQTARERLHRKRNLACLRTLQ